jgi:hypothetical protein
MKLTNLIAMFAAAMIVLATAVYGQTTSMKAEIPFNFRTPSGVLPAGAYHVTTSVTSSGMSNAVLTGYGSQRSVIILGSPKDYGVTGRAAIVFRCGAEDGCVLSAVVTESGTTKYPSFQGSKRDKEVAILLTAPASSVKAD